MFINPLALMQLTVEQPSISFGRPAFPLETEFSQPHLVHCAGAPVYNLSNGRSKKSQPFSPMFMGFVAHSVCPYHCPKTLALRAVT